MTFLLLQSSDPERAELEDEPVFVDILEERKCGTDLGFALRTFSPQPYREASSCPPSDLSRAVMESQFLRYVVKEVEHPGHQQRFVVGAVYINPPPAFLTPRLPQRRE